MADKSVALNLAVLAQTYGRTKSPDLDAFGVSQRQARIVEMRAFDMDAKEQVAYLEGHLIDFGLLEDPDQREVVDIRESLSDAYQFLYHGDIWDLDWDDARKGLRAPALRALSQVCTPEVKRRLGIEPRFRRPQFNAKVLHIETVEVREDLRGQGIGSALMQLVAKHGRWADFAILKAAPLTETSQDASKEQPRLYRFYGRLGFQRAGRTHWMLAGTDHLKALSAGKKRVSLALLKEAPEWLRDDQGDVDLEAAENLATATDPDARDAHERARAERMIAIFERAGLLAPGELVMPS